MDRRRFLRGLCSLPAIAVAVPLLSLLPRDTVRLEDLHFTRGEARYSSNFTMEMWVKFDTPRPAPWSEMEITRIETRRAT